MKKQLFSMLLLLVLAVQSHGQKNFELSNGSTLTIEEDNPDNCSRLWMAVSPLVGTFSAGDMYFVPVNGRFHVSEKIHLDFSTPGLFFTPGGTEELKGFSYFAGGTFYITSDDAEKNIDIKLTRTAVATGIPITKRKKLGINAGVTANKFNAGTYYGAQDSLGQAPLISIYNTCGSIYTGLSYAKQSHFSCTNSMNDQSSLREDYNRFYADVLIGAFVNASHFDAAFPHYSQGLTTSRIGYRVGCESYHAEGKGKHVGFYFGLEAAQYPHITGKDNGFGTGFFVSAKIGLAVHGISTE